MRFFRYSLAWLIAISSWPIHAFTIYDDVGYTLTLKAPPQRIISLAPSITENLFAIGAGERIVGTSKTSDYPSEAKNIPVVSDYQSINLEAVAALRPDVVIAWQGGNSPAQLAALTQLGIPIYFQRIRSLPEIPLALMRLAQLTQLEQTALPIIMSAYSKITLLNEAPKPTLRSFYQVWYSPVMTINKDSWIDDALARCGAHNVFTNLSITAPIVSVESVLQKNPELIITASSNATPNHTLDIWRTWPSLSAVQRHGLLFVDADSMNRATVRTLDASQKMCTDIAGIRNHS